MKSWVWLRLEGTEIEKRKEETWGKTPLRVRMREVHKCFGGKALRDDRTGTWKVGASEPMGKKIFIMLYRFS